MDKEFWISIKENNFEFPAEHSLSSLTEELISYIGSTDSELRDTIGLEAFYHWLIQDRYSTDDLRGIIIRLTANLHENIGEKEGDSAFLRSFSALWLANILSYDTDKTILEKEDILPIVEPALAYFAAERDQRGFVSPKGWVHATAHGADLLSSLANSLHTDAAHHINILNCIADKLKNTSNAVYLYNEDSRMARSVMGILHRNSLTLDQIKDWLTFLSSHWSGSWQNIERTRAYHNGRNFIRALYWSILMQTENKVPNHKTILELLKATLEREKPWDGVA